MAGPDSIVDEARERLSDALDQLPDRPALVDALLAPVVCTASWSITEAFGDRTQYVAQFSREGVTGIHVICWLVDENQGGGYAKSLLFASNGDELLAKMRAMIAAERNMSWAPIDPAALHARVRAAMDAEASIMGPVGDDEEDDRSGPTRG